MKDTVTRTAETLNETARDVWLAGLGAFSRAQKESQKTFDSLVKDGQNFEKKTRKDVNARVVSIRKTVEDRVTSVRKQTTGRFDKLEDLFEARVARVLARLGIPTADDINTLSRRVERLNKEVKALHGKKPATRKAA